MNDVPVQWPNDFRRERAYTSPGDSCVVETEKTTPRANGSLTIELNRRIQKGESRAAVTREVCTRQRSRIASRTYGRDVNTRSGQRINDLHFAKRWKE